MAFKLLRKFKRTSNSTISDRSDVPQREATLSTNDEVHLPPQPYLHKHFSNTEDEIRLVRRNRNGPHLDFSVFYVKQFEAPSYTALSYCWTSETSSDTQRQILIDGDIFEIGENLYQALCHDCVQYDTYAWVDVICINQDDKKEKAQQVQKMHTIFANAARTVAWLGIEDADSIGPLFQLAQTFPQRRTRYPSHEAWCINNCSFLEENLPDSDTALQQLFARPYWSRLWVLKEIAVSQDIIIQSGPYSCGLSALEALVYSSLYISSIQASDSHLLRLVLGLRQNIGNISTILGVGDLFELSRSGFKTADPQDKIYAILGLMPQTITLTVDYTRPMEATLIDLMKQRLTTEGPDVLGEAQAAKIPRNPNLPSWVADPTSPSLRSYTKQFLPHASSRISLQNKTPQTTNTTPSSTYPEPPFSYKATTTSQPTIHFNPTLPHLTIQGHRLSKITHVANTTSNATFNSNRVPTWVNKQYALHRFHASLTHQSSLTSPTSRFYNQPPSPLYPSTPSDSETLAWTQLMNPYTVSPEYWSFLDHSMGPTPLAADTEVFKMQLDFFDCERRAFLGGDRIGIGPGDVRVGDVLVAIQGARVLHVLRKRGVIEDGEEWVYVGEAFVLDAKCEEVEGERFTLV